MTGNPKPEENSACSGSNAEEEAEAQAEVQGKESPFQKSSPRGQVCTRLLGTRNTSILMLNVKTPEMIRSRFPKPPGSFPKGAQRMISQRLSEVEQSQWHTGPGATISHCCTDDQKKKNPSQAQRTLPSLWSRWLRPAAKPGHTDPPSRARWGEQTPSSCKSELLHETAALPQQ